MSRIPSVKPVTSIASAIKTNTTQRPATAQSAPPKNKEEVKGFGTYNKPPTNATAKKPDVGAATSLATGISLNENLSGLNDPIAKSL